MIFRLIGMLIVAWVLILLLYVIFVRPIVQARLRKRHLRELEEENERLDKLLSVKPMERNR